MVRNIFWTFSYQNLSAVLLSLVLTTFLVIVLSLVYWWQVRKKKVDDLPTGFLLLVELVLKGLEDLIKKSLGKKFIKLTPYFFYLLLYINLGNVITLFFGLESPFAFLTVVASLGFVTFLGIYYFGIYFEGWSFFRGYLNPLQFISQIASWISISFRLFGNILAGTFVVALSYQFLMNSELGQSLRWFNILAVLIAPLKFYFDVFSGTLHSFIFVLLTLTYWSLSRSSESS